MISGLRGDDSVQSYSGKNFIMQYEAIEKSVDAWLSRNLDDFFSYCNYYQEVINELQDNCKFDGKCHSINTLFDR